MKKFLLYLVSAILISFNHCTKNDGPDAGNLPDTSLKVKTITEDYLFAPDYRTDKVTHTVFMLEYDAQDRLIRMKSDSTNIEFEYSNNIIKKDIYELNRYGVHSEQHTKYYFGNASGLLDSSITISESSGTSEVRSAVYFYNSENIREQEIITDTNFVYPMDTLFYKYDTHGNLVGITLSNNPFYKQYIYYDSANFHNSADMIYPERVNSPNLLKEYRLSAPDGAGSERFSYEFDSNHRIIAITDSCSYKHTPHWIFTQSFTYY